VTGDFHVSRIYGILIRSIYYMPFKTLILCVCLVKRLKVNENLSVCFVKRLKFGTKLTNRNLAFDVLKIWYWLPVRNPQAKKKERKKSVLYWTGFESLCVSVRKRCMCM